MRYVFDESKLDDVIRAAYDLSAPQGLGFLHAKAGELDEATMERIKGSGYGGCVASMDYVHGRAVKLAIFRDGENLYIPADRWYDHSIESLQELAKRADLGLPVESGREV